MSYLSYIFSEKKKNLFMQDLFTLSLEKDLHAGKLEDTVIFFIARHIKKKKACV